MLRKVIISLVVLILILFFRGSAFSTPSLHNWAFNVNGSLYVKSFPANMNASGFDPNTGLGVLILNLQSLPAGSYKFHSFFDHEIEEAINGFTNEYGGSSGAPGPGQTWEIGEPGYQMGTIYNHFLSGSLNNTNGVPEGARDDVSRAMGWNFSLAAQGWVRITMVLTQDRGQVPANTFYLTHTDPESNESVYLYGKLEQGYEEGQYTVATNPAGLQVIVDGVPYTAPRVFEWVPGTTHTVSVVSPQLGASGWRYVFTSWSDGGGQSHTVTAPPGGGLFTANFKTQCRLTTTVSPAGGGAVEPSGTNWYDSGQEVTLKATANPGYTFSGWSGSITGGENPKKIVMIGPQNVVANFIGTPIVPMAMVPTMAEWGMVVVIVLIAMASMYVMKKKKRKAISRKG